MTKGELLKQKINYLRKQKLNIYFLAEKIERKTFTDNLLRAGNEKSGMDFMAERIKSAKVILQKG